MNYYMMDVRIIIKADSAEEARKRVIIRQRYGELGDHSWNVVLPSALPSMYPAIDIKVIHPPMLLKPTSSFIPGRWRLYLDDNPEPDMGHEKPGLARK